MARRVLALILLGLALIVCVVLAASESLTNRTGRTATAVTITFSEPVRITSYAESVFSTKDPSSRSDTFRFSAGQLENGAKFSVSWTPSTAEITSTEWETTGAAAGSTSSSAALTYEEIMAQSAHYPGPDEPLYVPAEGEQIWLTDLEGHADIYDNDSIKINYAPGFDKSQITRIDVYRNDVKMRFVATLVDVLTNEQMKTFDGNPAENTPKSSHTDHAIFGYEYNFRPMGADGQPLKTVSSRVASALSFSGTSRVASVGHDFFSRLSLPDAALRESLTALRGQGFTGIQIEANYFMSSASTSEFFAQYVPDPAVTEDWKRTATDSEIRRMARLAREVGLTAELRLELWLTLSYVASQQNWCWRGSIAPSSVSKWFSNYTDLCVRLARIAEEEQMQTFCAGVELNSMEQYRTAWEALAATLRGVFSGQLTFSEATHHYLAGYNTYSQETSFERNAGKFWGSLDAIGMNMWPGNGVGQLLEDRKDQRFGVMVQNFVAFWHEAFDYYSATYPGKPIRFEEMGIYDFDGVASSRATSAGPYPAGAVLDHQEFADMWSAYLIGAEYLRSQGVAVWTVEIDPYARYSWVGEHQVNMTPAIRCLEALFGQ